MTLLSISLLVFSISILIFTTLFVIWWKKYGKSLFSILKDLKNTKNPYILERATLLLNLSEIISPSSVSSITASYAEPTLLVNKITGSGKLTISQSFYKNLSNQGILSYSMQPYEVTYIKCII